MPARGVAPPCLSDVRGKGRLHHPRLRPHLNTFGRRSRVSACRESRSRLPLSCHAYGCMVASTHRLARQSHCAVHLADPVSRSQVADGQAAISLVPTEVLTGSSTISIRPLSEMPCTSSTISHPFADALLLIPEADDARSCTQKTTPRTANHHLVLRQQAARISLFAWRAAPSAPSSAKSPSASARHFNFPDPRVLLLP